MRKAPSVPETVSCLKLVCTLVATIFAPATTAPLLSCTTPNTEPVTSALSVAALKIVATARRSMETRLKRFNIGSPDVLRSAYHGTNKLK